MGVFAAVLAGSLGLMLVTGFAFAQEKKTYAKGETVKVKYVGEMVTGKVVSAKVSGFVEVEFDWKGKKLTKTFPLGLVEGSVAPVAPGKPVAGTPKPASSTKSPALVKSARPAVKPVTAATRSTPKPAGDTEPELRMWTNDTGKFKVEARFGGLEEGKVTLIKTDGSTISIPLEKLSEADRELATEVASSGESPFNESPDDAAESPFQESPDPARLADPQPAADSKSSANSSKTPAPTKGTEPERKKPAAADEN